MSHLSSIKELALDIAKLSKTLTTLAAEVESVLTQQSAEEAAVTSAPEVQTKAAKVEPAKKESSGTTSSEKEDKHVVTIEQVRGVLAEKSQAGFTGKVKEVLEKFGAAKLSAVNPKDYEALLAAASAIK